MATATASRDPGSADRSLASISTVATTPRQISRGVHADVGGPAADRVVGERGHLLAVGLHAERSGELLEPDDHRDAHGEPLDDRDRDVADDAARPGVPEADQDESGQQPDDEHAVGTVDGDDRDQHDGHRAGGSAHLDPAAAEDGRDGAGDDGRDQATAGAHAGADPEPEGERQRDQADHQARGQVTGRAHVREVRPVREQAQRPAQQAARRHRRVWGLSSASSSPCAAMIPERIRRAARSRSRTSGTLTE